MNFAVAATLAFALLAAALTAIAYRMSKAPVWRDLERAWPVGAVTTAFALLDLAPLVDGPASLLASLARLQFALGPALVLTWLRYSVVATGGTPLPAERWITRAVVASAALLLIPGAAIDGGAMHAHGDPILGGAWRHLRLTPLGHVLAAAWLAAAAWTGLRFVAAWRRGHAGARPIALSFGAALALAVLDYLVRADVVSGPHFVGAAVVLPLATAAWLLVFRFVADADSLHALRNRVEGLVEERTRDLAQAHAALLQAEKLAALGQFAAGVAHEVNNPASVVTANLSWLSGELARAVPPAELKEVVDESLDAMRRINELVRKLLDAGRLADLPPGSGTVVLAAAVGHALHELRAQARLDVDLVSRVPDDVLVCGGVEVVGRILSGLLGNAVESIPIGRKGRVDVSARVDGSTVRVVVEDDGQGMSSDTLRRAFDPFFTTKPLGRGSGLGLPITRGLVEGIGGQIWLESEPGKGTRVAVELPIGQPS